MDIGTRSVVGLVVEASPDGCYNILATAKEEHQERAMLGGQIQDVDEVAAVASKVKQLLEEELDFSLQKVAVAAAGRTLITICETTEQEVSPWYEIREEQALCLELDAILQAQQSLVKEHQTSDDYYCVGYSVIAYYLDGRRIGNPIGQRGKKLAVDLIATFLPCVVIDSLVAVLERCGLQMDFLTLEPIAAFELVIPPTMRQLNLALLDIGAGTSDIAVTDQGNVSAYAMVPLAGDAVTEKLCSEYLLDFIAGEQLKRKLKTKKNLSIKDVLGVRHQVAKTDVLASIKDTVREMAQRIGKSILELNGRTPQAVICIGGGSLTPELTTELAVYLGLPAERVAVRKADGITSIKGLNRILAGPEGVTPLGIAMMAAQPHSLGLCQVQVNERMVKMFRGNTTTVADALLAADIGFSELYGLPGSLLTINVNGEEKLIKGEPGEPAEIHLDGTPVSLDTPLSPGAVVKVGTPKPGRGAKALVKDVMPLEIHEFCINLNGQPRILSPLVYMNGKMVSVDTAVVDHAHLTCRNVETISDALLASGFSQDELVPPSLQITINNIPEVLEREAVNVYINGKKATLQDSIRDGDDLICEPCSKSIRIKDIIKDPRFTFSLREITVVVNGETVTLKGCGMRILKNGVETDEDDIINDGDDLLTTGSYELILTDIFRYISLERTPPGPSSKLITLVNGREAQFTTPLQHGDQIEVYWKEPFSTTNH